MSTTTLRLEIGKRYVNRDGEVTGPLTPTDEDIYAFMDEVTQLTYTAEGQYVHVSLNPHQRDLVSEYVEPSLPATSDSDQPTWSPTDEPEDTSPDAPDPVNHPPHYKQGDIECIDAIRSALTPEEFRGYLKGNALKYVWRERHKGSGDQDLQKAVWYLTRLTEGGVK